MPEFVPFNFKVHLYNESNNQMLCQGLFSEVQGLDDRDALFEQKKEMMSSIFEANLRLQKVS